MNRSRTSFLAGRRPAVLLGAAVAAIAIAASLVGLTVESAAAPPTGATLDRALAAPAGNAAGDGILRSAPNRLTVPAPSDPNAGDVAARVNAGEADQAADVPLTSAQPSAPAPAALLAGSTGGCTPGYGRGEVCLPLVSAAAAEMSMSMQQMPWTCDEVRKLLPAGIVVNSVANGVAPGQRDPLHLDLNQDGKACGPHDQ